MVPLVPAVVGHLVAAAGLHQREQHRSQLDRLRLRGDLDGPAFLGVSSSDMRSEPNSWRRVRQSPVAMMGPVGTTEPPAGSAVMLRREGRVEPAMVKAAWRGDPPSRPSEMGGSPRSPRAGRSGRLPGTAGWRKPGSPARRAPPPPAPAPCASSVSRSTSRCPGTRSAAVTVAPGCRGLQVGDPVVGPHQRDAEDDGDGGGRHGDGGGGGDRGAPEAPAAIGERSERASGARGRAAGIGGGSSSCAARAAGGDGGPETFGQRLHRVAHGRRDLPQAVELGPAAGADLQVLLQLGELVAVDGIEGVRSQELAGLLVGHHASTPRTPASARTARMRRMPLRIRLLTVPSG